MDILKPISNHNEYPIFFLFGRGLIGGTFRKFIIDTGCYFSISHSSDWQHWYKTAEIFDNEIKKNAPHKNVRIEVVWCAGKTTFLSSYDETNAELIFFEKIITFFARFLPQYDSGITLISSAGAMFEGQRLIRGTTAENPLRPYSFLKKRQEEIISSLNGIKKVRIFRLSSVYGYISEFSRMGLITTLIYNGLKGHVTNIVGNFSTLRDYVFVDDVGCYLARKILFSPTEKGGLLFYTLASGKPVSILEAIRIIEFLLKKKLLIRFDFSKSNAADITYSSSLMPNDWAPQNLIVGAKSIIREWQKL